MAAYIDLDPDSVLLVGEARIEVVKKRGSKVRLKVDAPESVKLAKQTKPKLTKPAARNRAETPPTRASRMSATELK